VAAGWNEEVQGLRGHLKEVPGILGERARPIRGGDRGGTVAAVAWSRGRGGERRRCWQLGPDRQRVARRAGEAGRALAGGVRRAVGEGDAVASERLSAPRGLRRWCNTLILNF